MRHLVRAGVLLAILLANIFALRRAAVPSASVQTVLAKYDVVLDGTNREADSIEWASQPVKYLGPSDCGECHLDKFTQWGRSKHHVVICEDCHGPAQAHLQSGMRLAVETSPELCESCHGQLPSRPGSFPQVIGERHAAEDWTCVSCHNPHYPEAILQAEAGAAAPEIAHGVEGQDDCVACHAAGGIAPFPESHAGRTNELCLGCHPPLTAPAAPSQTPVFVALASSFPKIPHQTEGRSDCLLCHNPEGLLPFPDDHGNRTNDMCQTCHTPTR